MDNFSLLRVKMQHRAILQSQPAMPEKLNLRWDLCNDHFPAAGFPTNGKAV